MKFLLSVAIMAMFYATANAACKELGNCDTCSNPGSLCASCPKETIMSNDKKSCIACGDGCSMCTADSKDKISCTTCKKANYLNKAACTACPEGCGDCTLDTDGKTVKCNACAEKYGTKTDDKGVVSCVACSSNCKACSVNTDGTTKCTSCPDYKGLAKRGYFLKKKDFTCSSCPTYCEACTDDGNSVGICKTCYKGYNPLEDTADSTKSGTSCLKCPTDCTTCTGVKTGSAATCTACKADAGLYVTAGACTTCGTGAKACTDKGVISACKDKYRFESDACTACPAFCKECPKDAATGTVSCATCDATYGPKPTKSVTCDDCGIANCETCQRLTDGTGKYKCTACKKGTALKTDTECATCASPCKSGETCTYDKSNSKFLCETCKDASYISNPKDNSGTCDLCSTSAGKSDCSKCKYDTNKVVCQDCTYPTLLTTADGKCIANIDTKSNGVCTEAYKDGTKCTTCKSGYGPDGVKCVKCDPANCDTCDGSAPTLCTTCTAPLYVTYKKDKDAKCIKCTEKSNDGTKDIDAIANCAKCAWVSTAVKCSGCDAGYLLNTAGLKCIANVDKTNTKCTALDTGSDTDCKTCADGYGPVTSKTNCPKCNDANCKTCAAETGSEKKCKVCNAKYITTDSSSGGDCKGCPTKCSECSYDSTNKKTKCTSGKCDKKYILNADAGSCDACTENCDVCAWDTTNKKTECKTPATGYGLLKDKTCGSCPAHCDACARDSAPDADDTLYCSTCTNAFAENKDVCAGCPSNCHACADNKGTMECSKCNDHYALSSKKACVKCPTNCNKCSATSTASKCSECKVGYSLSSDGTTCTDCATAAFTGCANCTYTDAVSGKANCTACATGYTLEDGVEHLSCIDVSSLQCGAGTYSDVGPQCSACSSGFALTKTLMCGKKCYSCGDVNADVYVDKTKCTIPASGANATLNDAKQVECLSGICYAAFQDGKVAAGCLPSKDTLGTCTGDRAAGETCATANSKEKCERCCTTVDCNAFVADMDGKPDSAVATAVNLILISFAAVLAIRFN